MKQHVSAYSNAIIRFTNVSYRKLITMRGMWQMLGSRHHALQSEKCKAVPLQAWSDPEGSIKLRFPHFMTTAQDAGKVVSLSTGRL